MSTKAQLMRAAEEAHCKAVKAYCNSDKALWKRMEAERKEGDAIDKLNKTDRKAFEEQCRRTAFEEQCKRNEAVRRMAKVECK